MTNKEKYYDELINYALAGVDIAIDKNTNKIVACREFNCSDCEFGGYGGVTCYYYKLKWLNEEYIEPKPETDWSKVEVDTPILIRARKTDPWEVRYFAKYQDGVVWSWCYGKTSYTTVDAASIYNWNFFKLPTPEELEEYRKKV